MKATLTSVGGPTALIDVGGVRLLTDPTFDEAGTAYPAPEYTLHKTAGPFAGATIVPLHDEGWTHFTESRR
jgi:hypothetical protein